MNKEHGHLNRFSLMGTIERVKTKKNGSRVIYLRASNRPDKMMTGAVSSPTFFTGVLLLRISHSAIEYAHVSETTLVPDTEVFVEGHIQGVGHKIQGEDYFTTELWAHRVRRVHPSRERGEKPDLENTLIQESQDDATMATPLQQKDAGDVDTKDTGKGAKAT